MIIAVASGKGGTGKTLLSTAMALSADSCTYMDLDVEEPNGSIFIKPEIISEHSASVMVPDIHTETCTFCGLCSKSCVYHALAVIPALNRAVIFPELCHSCGVCLFVCPISGTITESKQEIGKIRIGSTPTIQFIEGRLNIKQPSAVPLINNITEQFLNSKTDSPVIIDSPPGTSCPVVSSLKKSDYVVLVTEPTPFGLNDLELAVELVKDLEKNFGIIINKDDQTQTLIDDFATSHHIPILMRIPYSIEIQKAYSQGIPLTESRPETAILLKTLIKRITSHSYNKECTIA